MHPFQGARDRLQQLLAMQVLQTVIGLSHSTCKFSIEFISPAQADSHDIQFQQQQHRSGAESP